MEALFIERLLKKREYLKQYFKDNLSGSKQILACGKLRTFDKFYPQCNLI